LFGDRGLSRDVIAIRYFEKSVVKAETPCVTDAPRAGLAEVKRLFIN
jgi:hypothetical protein